jgi:hypothetical protein
MAARRPVWNPLFAASCAAMITNSQAAQTYI